MGGHNAESGVYVKRVCTIIWSDQPFWKEQAWLSYWESQWRQVHSTFVCRTEESLGGSSRKSTSPGHKAHPTNPRVWKRLSQRMFRCCAKRIGHWIFRIPPQGRVGWRGDYEFRRLCFFDSAFEIWQGRTPLLVSPTLNSTRER